jgi:predicted RNA polymerase sigma factor
MRTTAQIIAALGGRDVVAELTGARPRTVEQWLRIGVPHKHFGLLVTQARAKGIRGVNHEALYAAKAETIRSYRNGAA